MTHILTLIVALFLLLYFTFTAFTVYFVMVSKRTNGTTMVGNIIWYHGVAWVVGMIAIVIVTMAILLAHLLITSMHLTILFGG